MVKLTFLGATGTVTGSKYLVDTGKMRILVDDGLYQGPRKHRRRNWDPLPIEPGSIDAVVATHGHIDHIGVVPRLCRHGFGGPIHASRGTVDIAHLVLPDSGRLQEEDARYANRKGFSKHRPAKPLYTEKDAKRSLRQFVRHRYDQEFEVGPGVRCRFVSAGHICGSTHVLLTIKQGGGRSLRILFSGDVGQFDVPILRDPSPLPACDVLLTESTYGDRDHGEGDPRDELAAFVSRTIHRGGRVLIPAFAVGRSQLLLYLLHELRDAGRIPDVPIVLDSPMSQKATGLLLRHEEDHDEEMKQRIREGRTPLGYAQANAIGSTRKSRGVARWKRTAVIVSASGMATGGRVLHHLKYALPDPRCGVLFAGFQAYGTRGRRLVNGEKQIKMHGEWVDVGAEIGMIHGLSAHADRGQLIRWMSSLPTPPRQVFVTHGEPEASAAFRDKIDGDLGWNATVPDYLDEVAL